MSSHPDHEIYAGAVEHHRAGQLREAESLYRQVLVQNGRHADALAMLGLLAHQTGRTPEAIQLLRRALTINPAVSAFHNRLGLLLATQRQLDQAIDCFQRAATLDPQNAEAQFNLGNAFNQSGNSEAAIAAYGRAIAAKPGLVEAHTNLAAVLWERGELDDAAAAFRKVLELRPDSVDAMMALGTLLQSMGRADEAIPIFNCALAKQPDNAEAHFHLGNVWMQKGNFDQAIACFERAAALRPGYAEAQSNIASALKESGRLDEAIARYREAERRHADPRIGSNLVYTLHFHPDFGPHELWKEHSRWRYTYAHPLSSSLRPHDNDPNPDRRLRIGYVSPDLCNHSVARFLLPLLANHDRETFEIFAYSDVLRPDGVTEVLASKVNVWRRTVGLSDEGMADLIRGDRIDILVDLTMHMAGNRLLLFARKPAPVQVTYLAYCSTTGLDTIDYRLSDPHLDPPSVDESCYSENTFRLPQTYWCYDPHPHSPPVNALPAQTVGHVTFGCLNNYAKVSGPTKKAWRQLLQRVTGSRLVVYSHEGSHRQHLRDFFAAEGIDPQRLQFVGRLPFRQHLERYWQIDIALDPFPYGGGTTTCDALWMGVPVVSLAGATAVSRSGLSILSNVGLAQLVADTPEAYVNRAVELAADLPRLAELRATMRQRMQASPLMQPVRFTRDVEAAYRRMWREWCVTRANPVKSS